MTAVARTGQREGSFVRGVRPPFPSGRRGGTGGVPAVRRVLEFRRRDAIQRTWALVIAAAICYSGQYPAGDADDHADVRGARHHHQRRRLPLHVGIVVPRADPAGRERDDPAGEAGGPRVPPGHGAARLGPEQPGAGAAVSRPGDHRAVVDGSTCSSPRSSSP